MDLKTFVYSKKKSNNVEVKQQADLVIQDSEES